MNRRNFIENILLAGASFMILPGAGRIWRAQLPMSISYIDFDGNYHFYAREYIEGAADRINLFWFNTVTNTRDPNEWRDFVRGIRQKYRAMVFEDQPPIRPVGATHEEWSVHVKKMHHIPWFVQGCKVVCLLETPSQPNP